MIIGTPVCLAAYKRGALTYPPVLITAAGQNPAISFRHFKIPPQMAKSAGKILIDGLSGTGCAGTSRKSYPAAGTSSPSRPALRPVNIILQVSPAALQ